MFTYTQKELTGVGDGVGAKVGAKVGTGEGAAVGIGVGAGVGTRVGLGVGGCRIHSVRYDLMLVCELVIVSGLVR